MAFFLRPACQFIFVHFKTRLFVSYVKQKFVNSFTRYFNYDMRDILYEICA